VNFVAVTAISRVLSPLARRQALQIGMVAISLLAVSGLSEMWFSYREARQQLARLQTAQAEAAAREIGQYLQGLEAGLRDTAKFPWGAEGYGPARQQQELHRLMVLYPALAEVRTVDGAGRLVVAVSRTEPDRTGPGTLGGRAPSVQAAVPGTVRYGQPFFRNGSEPYVEVSVGEQAPAGDEPRGTTIAVLHLRLVADVLERVGQALGGKAYLVDGQNRLIVHPTQLEMLRQRDMSQRPEQLAARRAAAARQPLPAAMDATDLDGHATLSTAVASPQTGWLLFLEQPRSVLMAPAWATLRRTGWLMGLAAALAALASAWQGRRLAQPILALRQASSRIAAGDFHTQVQLNRRDELALLADDLNDMARRLGSFYQELEAQVQQRTEQLSHARDVAERASLAKTRFLAAASHDLRQPMHTVGLLVGVLRSRLVQADHQSLLQKLGGSVEMMERLFSSLLDISKLDAGAVQPRLETFPVQDLMARLAQQFEPQAEQAGLRLRVQRCHALIRSDLGLLERCLANLLANAIRYTPHGGHILLGARRRGDQLALQVWDTGVGIAPADQPLVFEEFVRLPSAENAAGKGLGLGLAIVQRTAALLGHGLALQSAPGRGSMFELRVPRLEGAATHLDDAPTAAVTRLQGQFVLVVDDDPDNRHALGALCQRWGCLVAVAGSVEEAHAELEKHLRSPDLLITDLCLGPTHAANGSPQPDGLDLIAMLRDAQGDLPALLLTADTSAATQARARDLGVPVLHKPAGAERLAEALTVLSA
jgi:signal transduction histidine kinase/ActR/RegA family two-component response regulator